LTKMLLHVSKYPSKTVMGLLLAPQQQRQQTLDSKSDLQGASPTTKKAKVQMDSSAVHVCDVIPLFHTPALAPMMEVAFVQVEEWCREEGLFVCGVYTANDILYDTVPCRQSVAALLRIHHAIVASRTSGSEGSTSGQQQHHPHQPLLVVDNSKLTDLAHADLFQVYRCRSSSSSGGHVGSRGSQRDRVSVVQDGACRVRVADDAIRQALRSFACSGFLPLASSSSSSSSSSASSSSSSSSCSVVYDFDDHLATTSAMWTNPHI